MSQPRRPGIAPPKVVGVNVSKDPVVSKYTQGIVERAREAGKSGRVPIPRLDVAAQEYRPGKDPPMTMSQMAQAQENIRTMDAQDESKTSLKPETIAGLRALNEQMAKQHQQPASPESSQQDEQSKQPEEKKSVTRLNEDEKRAAAETADLDFDLMLSRLRSDVINNDKEREAVEARLTPMDLTDGLLTGEFKQLVPIQPKKLEVMFRSISPLENEEIRRKLLEEVIGDERIAQIQGEKLGLWQTICAVKMINGQEMPSHLRSVKGAHEFEWSVFEQKVRLFMSYPGPLIHALSTHAYWFDLRVRKLFSSTALKNG